MKKLATLFSDSYAELKQVRTLTIMAMFGAISIVLGYFTIVIGDYIKIGFSTIAGQMVYYLFGPVVGGCFGGALDILKYIVKPTGAFFPGWTFGAILAGVLYGMVFYKKPLTLGRVLRAFKNLVMWPVNSMLFYTIAKTVEATGILRIIRGVKLMPGNNQ